MDYWTTVSQGRELNIFLFFYTLDSLSCIKMETRVKVSTEVLPLLTFTLYILQNKFKRF
jgi:hypothetical protein